MEKCKYPVPGEWIYTIKLLITTWMILDGIMVSKTNQWGYKFAELFHYHLWYKNRPNMGKETSHDNKSLTKLTNSKLRMSLKWGI